VPKKYIPIYLNNNILDNFDMNEFLTIKDKLGRTIAYQNNFSYKTLYRIDGGQVLEFEKARKKASLRERKNIKDLKPEEEELLKTAVEKAVSSGEYAKLATFHSQYMFDIHSFIRANQRFLPWHRVYLVKFEEMLNEVMKQATGEDHNIAVPYWNWAVDRDIPKLFQDPVFTPTFDLDVYVWSQPGFPPVLGTYNIKVKRFPGTDPDVPELPTQQDIDLAKSETVFPRFSLTLEGRPHGRVHVWIGGVNPDPDPNNIFDSVGAMGDPHISPCDPIFYLHHANLDRIWAGWQKKLEEQGNTSNIYPDLDEEESKMHPWWPEYTELETRQIEIMGYTYDNYD
jgi:tyrosinase